MKKRIAVVGVANLDRLYEVPSLPSADTVLWANGYQESWGGKSLNQALAASHAGAEVSLHMKVGRKDYKDLCSFLEAKGLNSSGVISVEAPTNHGVFLILPSGDTSILAVPGSAMEYSTRELDQIVEQLDSNDILVVQKEFHEIPYLMKAAKSKGCTIVFNASPVTDDMERYPLDLVDFLFVNEVEALAISKKDAIKESLSWFAEWYPNLCVILTRGKEGSLLQIGGSVISRDCDKVEAVDTLGAGDTYLGYFICAWMEGKPLEQCMEIASKAAAIMVTRIGTAEVIPMKSELEGLQTQS
ncbi:MAG: PfkB family carbohydrate kinase [Sphaerochaetaceae bacterium]|nr:PfkB family carbohydrate kinase [Sphaerochaetaceae bacterium]